MGSSPLNEPEREIYEGPQHQVTIPHDFAVSTYEITREEYAHFVRSPPSSGEHGCFSFDRTTQNFVPDDTKDWRNPFPDPVTDRDPVTCVNWHDTQRYVRWLSEKTGKKYLLLTEAEWEYVARAGTDTAKFFGADPQCRYANGADRTFLARFPALQPFVPVTCADGYVFTSPVGSFHPNVFHLYDVLGNVWVEDCWHDSYEGAPTMAQPLQLGHAVNV